ncbi:hypothetical protein C9426_09310 [Serratia sp. S1B]|nr:hypothetical protein C9426_09310 [Serratia sp. S1B]
MKILTCISTLILCLLSMQSWSFEDNTLVLIMRVLPTLILLAVTIGYLIWQAACYFVTKPENEP